MTYNDRQLRRELREVTDALAHSVTCHHGDPEACAECSHHWPVLRRVLHGVWSEEKSA
jgi:hypothetical protein